MIRKKKDESLSEGLHETSSSVLLAGLHILPAMSQFQIKSLHRRLENLSIEATDELDRVCGHELWKNIGFDAFDTLDDTDRRATANYYYGQWQTVKEIQAALP